MRTVNLIAAALVASTVSLATGAAQQPMQQGAPAARLEPRTSSEQAKALFRDALFEAQNIGGATRIRRAIDSAVKIDPQFALARVYQAFAGPGTGDVRAQSISDLLSGMGSAPVPEILLAIYWRESAARARPFQYSRR